MKKSEKLSNFRMDSSGNYTYIGSYVTWQKSEEEYKALMSKKAAYILAFFGLQAGLGCVPKSGMDGNPFVILPYVASFVLSLVMLYTFFVTVKSGKKKRVYEYEETVPRMEVLSKIGMVFTALCLMAYFASGFAFGFATPLYPVFHGIGFVLCTLGEAFCRSETEFWQKD